MRKAFGILIAITLFLGIANSFSSEKSSEKTVKAPAGGKTDIPVKGYKLVWSDEFDGKTLDMTKWGYRALGKRGKAYVVKDTVNLDGQGNLVMTTKKSGDQYHTAMISTTGKYEPTFGYFECRVLLQTQIGHWSAFWLKCPTYGKEVGNPAACGAEIDIYEYLRTFGDGVEHAVHWDGYGKDHKEDCSKTLPIPGLGKGWHTFGLLWTETEYVFYVDGKETWRTKNGISKRSEYIILSLEVGEWIGGDAGDIAKANLPDHLYVDYVRVYQKDKAEAPTTTVSK